MKSVLLLQSVLLLTLSAQTARPAFEVASIHPSAGAGEWIGIRIQGTMVLMDHVTPGTLVRSAFGVEARYVKAAYGSLAQPAFDIAASLSPGASPREVPGMIRSLLEDRFQLHYHFETEERTVLALLVDPSASNPQLPRATGVDESLPGGGFAGINAVSRDQMGVWASPSGATYRVGRTPDGGSKASLTGATMTEFAFHLNTLDGLDIVDMTGLSGHFDFEWTASPDETCECVAQPTVPVTTPSYRESLKRLGLRLEKRKAPVQILIVDQFEKTPSDN